MLTFPEGDDVVYDNVRIYRTPKLPFIKNISPGFSGKKLVCDGFMLIQAINLCLKYKYDIVHSVEESAFIALVLKVVFRTPYIYDMDSSLAQQMIEKFSFLSSLRFLFNAFERLAVQQAKVVIPVCETLSEDIQVYKPKRVVVLPDISLLDYSAPNKKA
ncbi:glycosyltransferase [Acaryochloris marina]|nr:glycosyl transferase family 1 [Acaryochloris marina]